MAEQEIVLKIARHSSKVVQTIMIQNNKKRNQKIQFLTRIQRGILKRCYLGDNYNKRNFDNFNMYFKQ